MIYKWKNTSGTTIVNSETGKANIIGKEFEQIEAKHGVLTPELVLETAKDEGNYLHKYFEWDDTIASEKFRIIQARFLIRAIDVVVEKESTQAYVHIKEKNTGLPVYKSITKVINDEDEYRYICDRAKTEFLSYKDKYEKIMKYDDLKKIINDNI